MILILFFYMIMASVYTFGKQVVFCASPCFLTGVRIMAGGLFFLAWQWFSDRKHFVIKRESFIFFAFYAVATFIMDNGRLQALCYAPSSHAALIATTAPFIAALLSLLFFKERLSVKKILALCIGVLSVALLLSQHFLETAIPLSHSIIACVGMGASTVAFVLCGMLSKIVIKQQGNSFFMCVGTAMTGGGAIGFLFSFLFESWDPLPVSNPLSAAKLITYLILTHSLIAYPLYNYLVQKYPLTLVAFAQLATPFFTAFLSFILFGETINSSFIVSLFVFSGALFLFYQDDWKKQRAEKAANRSL